MTRYIVAYNPDDPKPLVISQLDIIHSREGHYYVAGSAPMIGRHNLEALGQHIRQLCPSDVREIEDIDRQIADLQERRRHFLAWAFGNNPPLSADEVKGMVRE